MEEKWKEEAIDDLFYVPYEGLFNDYLEQYINKYIGEIPMDENFTGTPNVSLKIKIKAKDGKILIERIEDGK